MYNVALLKQAWPNLLWPYLSQPNQPGPSSLDPLKAKKKVCVGGGENQKYCIAKVKVFKFTWLWPDSDLPDHHLTCTWPSPDLDLSMIRISLKRSRKQLVGQLATNWWYIHTNKFSLYVTRYIIPFFVSRLDAVLFIVPIVGLSTIPVCKSRL